MNEIMSIDTERLLKISFLPKIGVATLRKFIFQSNLQGRNYLDQYLKTYNYDVNNYSESSCDEKLKKTKEVCFDLNINVLSPMDDIYPRQLFKIDDYPPLLYVKGAVSTLNGLCCAIVGTREASTLGLSWAKQIAEIFSKNGFCVVSGLALGIDTSAHEGALLANKPTVSVLAHGLDMVSPASNTKLAKRILEGGGALVSEHPPGIPPYKAEYVRRNRLQSGLSVCSVVVESGSMGGAIYQGRFTTEQKRTLYCIIPDNSVIGADLFSYAGGIRLINEYAGKPIANSNELMGVINSGKLQEDYAKLILSKFGTGMLPL